MSLGSIGAVRAFAGRRAVAQERCDFCGEPVAASHAHVLDASGTPRCACGACALLFSHGRTNGFRRIESFARKLTEEVCSDRQWTALGIPVGLAWLFRDGADGHARVQYPGAAGAVEGSLDGASIRVLDELEPAVEALLIRRWRDRSECWRVSIDHCWRLAGLMRSGWRGLDGGAELHAGVDAFFRALAHA